MKKICFLILFTLQFSLFCFSQSDSIHYYTDEEIVKLTGYISSLEKINPAAITSESDQKKKQEIDKLLSSPSHAFSDSDIITLNNYIKYLEKTNDVVGANGEKTPSNDSLHAYTGAEITKLTNHISDLEKKVSAFNPSEPNPGDKQQIVALLAYAPHEYTDAQIIKLANYIKHLEQLDSENAIAMANKANENKGTEVAKVTETGNPTEKEYILPEEKDIDKFEKLIFFNFNSASLKEESYKPLDEVVKILKSYVNLNFIVEGYCDSIGSAAYNLGLSQRRAATVKSYFISKGIPATRVSSKGYGKEFPIATNLTEEGRAQNRRVAIRAKRK